MSRFKRKTSEVLEEGRASRETWTPQLGSAPLRVYRWWLRQTGRFIYQENFCHFWRVVLIWAPLLRLRQVMRLDKMSAPRLVHSSDGFIDKVFKVFPAFLVLELLALLSVPTMKLWPDYGWWALLIGPSLVAVSIAVAIGSIAAGAGIVKLVRRHPTARSQSIAQRVRSAGRTTGEFIVLTGQVVRVKKWKICPLVEIPPEA